MMKQMRENTKWIMLITALAFVALMVFEWGMDMSGRSAGALTGGELGRVNGVPITYGEFSEVYRDLYEPDSTYHYLCAPNDTHGCLLKASVKNGVAVYADPSFGYRHATDAYGNRASARWDPRACVSGQRPSLRTAASASWRYPR